MNTMNVVQVRTAGGPNVRHSFVGKMLRWGGIVLAGIVVLLLFVVFGVYVSAEYRLNKTYTIAVESLTIPTDTQAIIRGEHWTALYCADCHGANSAGKVIFDDPALGHIAAGNLTRGKGGVGAVYRDADWIRAIRHGVGPDGKALLGMPSADFYNLSDRDLGELVAYLKVLPPVDAVMEERSLTPFGKVLIGAGVMHDAMQAEGIDHGGARPPASAPAVSTAYGEYLVRSTGCRTCHGAALTGGTSPDPKAPPAPDITQRGALRLWSEQMFIGQARTRVGEFMPWKVLNAMSDDELRAMWLYLKAVPVQ